MEMLTDYEVTRKDNVNGEKTLDVTIIKTKRNDHAYDLVINENGFFFDNEEYVIKTVKERIVGKTVKKECKAIHKFFIDLKDHYIYDQISGAKRIRDLLSFVLGDTFYFADVDDTGLPLSVELENFGDDNALSLFKKILDKFGAEFDIMQSYIFIAKEIGYRTDIPIRYKLNLKDPQKEIDTSSLSTYIRGYGKQNDDGSYVAYQEYTSPLADVYGIRHAKPVRDERYKDNTRLLDRIKRELHDSIDISLSLTYVELQKMGLLGHVHKGDYVWCILEPFNINVEIRVIEIEEYSNPNKSPKYKLGTISKKATDVMASFNTTKKTVENVVNTDTNTIKRRALSTETNYVVDAVERTFAEISYTDDISASDPDNFMRRVGLRKGGIYRSTDGNYRYFVITPEGLDLSQVFGKLAPAHVEIGPETTFAPGYDPTEIEVDPPVIPLASETQNGLMSKEDKAKLNQILIDSGQVIDLSILMQKIIALETENETQTEQIEDLLQRVEALEGGLDGA